MSIFKRGKLYWYHFIFNGQHIQESSKQGNPRVARQIEAAHRTSLAKGEVGFRAKKPTLTVAEFCSMRMEPWTRSTFQSCSPRTWLWYRSGLRSIWGYPRLADMKLDEVTSEHIADFAAHRQAQGLQVAGVNGSLQVLRRCLRLAVEWGILVAAPKIKLLRGARHRERVLTTEEEIRYLAAAPEPLASIASVLVDTGMRPEECFRLRWESITWINGRNGSVLVTHGKTPAARRMLPMSPRVRAILETQWKCAGKTEEGWVWPAPTRSGHVEPSSIRKQHAKTFKSLAEHASNSNVTPLRPFVLYSLRHTFLTRLGESGCNVWTLARVAGHSSIVMSARYVHPGEDAVLNALDGLQRKRLQQKREESESGQDRRALPA